MRSLDEERALETVGHALRSQPLVERPAHPQEVGVAHHQLLHLQRCLRWTA
jgi:hypothetical protein